MKCKFDNVYTKKINKKKKQAEKEFKPNVIMIMT